MPQEQTHDPGWDAALLDAWRDEAGRGAGICYIEVLPGKPKLAFDLNGAVQLILEGRMGNPLLTRGKELVDREAAVYEAAKDAADTDPSQARFWAHHQEVMGWQSAVIGCAWASPPNPPWCAFDDLPAGGRPPGQFCIHDIQPPARRRMLVDLVIAGAEGLATFRAQSAVLDAAQDGRGLRPAAEQLPDSELSATPEVLAGRSGVASRDDRGLEAAGGAGHLHAVPWEPDAERQGAADSLGA